MAGAAITENTSAEAVGRCDSAEGRRGEGVINGYKSAEGLREEEVIDGIQISKGMHRKGCNSGIQISRGLEGRGNHKRDTNQQRDAGERAP